MTMEAKIGHYFKRLTMIENTFGDTDYHLRRVTDSGRADLAVVIASRHRHGRAGPERIQTSWNLLKEDVDARTSLRACVRDGIAMRIEQKGSSP